MLAGVVHHARLPLSPFLPRARQRSGQSQNDRSQQGSQGLQATRKGHLSLMKARLYSCANLHPINNRTLIVGIDELLHHS
jgi:hypothetical protein